MKVNIGYLNCYDSILRPNLIKIFYNTKHKVCFSLKIRLHSKQELLDKDFLESSDVILFIKHEIAFL